MMKDLDVLKEQIRRAKQHLDYMLEDASEHADPQAFMESAAEAQRLIMEAVTIVFVASQKG
jgi:hypothetical protein